MPETILDYSHYFWQGSQIRLRAFTVDDADYRFAQSLDSLVSQVVHPLPIGPLIFTLGDIDYRIPEERILPILSR